VVIDKVIRIDSGVGFGIQEMNAQAWQIKYISAILAGIIGGNSNEFA
jgi:hypothetical protein